MTPDDTIDCEGLLCPLPVLKARKRLLLMQAGQCFPCAQQTRWQQSTCRIFVPRQGIACWKRCWMAWCRSTSFAEGGTGDEASRVGSNEPLLFHAVSRVAADGTENLTSI